MIKGELKLPEAAAKIPLGQACKNLETNLLTEEMRLKTSETETGADKLDVKIRFTRLKRRMRTRSSSIF